MIFTAGGMHAHHGKDQKGGKKPAQDRFLRSLGLNYPDYSLADFSWNFGRKKLMSENRDMTLS